MRRRLLFARPQSRSLWALLWLVPLLVMGTVSNVPHEHDLQELAAARAARMEQAAKLPSQAPSPSGLSQQAQAASEHAECLLCSAATAHALLWAVAVLPILRLLASRGLRALDAPSSPALVQAPSRGPPAF